MIPGLHEALDARFTFVVGKGGVGKSTTAAALGLASGDRGVSTHLISTDPAHSLGDIFGQSLNGGSARAACSSELTLEEVEGAALARSWVEESADALAELVEHGSYLDREDVEDLLHLALPGMDEVGAALRLTELERGGAVRVVVDTAPTGHTLRLLDADRAVGGWTAGFRAMEAKASAVAGAFASRPIRWAATDVLDRLEERLADYRERVLDRAEFVVVFTAGAVVREETNRLEAALRERGLRLGARVRNGSSGEGDGANEAGEAKDAGEAGRRQDGKEVPLFVAPWRALEPGCEDLRAWGTPEEEPVANRDGAVAGEGIETGRSRQPEPPADDRRARGAAAGVAREEPDAVKRLLGRDLLLVAGKGGVGKSTCAAAVAVALSREKSVALLGTDPAGSLGDLLRVPRQSGSPPSSDRLLVRQVDAPARFSEFREAYRERIDRIFRDVGLEGHAELDRRVLESIWEFAPPGADEIFSLVELLGAGEDREILVVDTAPTGHFLRLLEMPELALAWTHRLMRILLKYREVAALDAPAERLLEFARRLRRLRVLLLDPRRAGVLLVTLDEPVVRRESDRLQKSLERAGVPVMAILENRSTESTSALPGPPRLIAPELSSPPSGTEQLLSFFESWRVTGDFAKGGQTT